MIGDNVQFCEFGICFFVLQRSGVQQRWKEKPKTEAIGNAETVTNKLSGIHIGESTAIWKPKSYGTVSGGATVTEVESTPVGSGSLSNISRANMLEKFTVDNSTYAHARIRASFYPKFENEKSDQEVYDSCLCFLCFYFVIRCYIVEICHLNI
jgi:uncharacterized protein YutD